MKLKAAAFDMDGTLYPNRRLIGKALPFFLKNLKLTVNFSRVRRDIRQKRPINDFYRVQDEMLAESMGISAEESHRIIREIIYNSWPKVMQNVRPYAGVGKVLEELKKRGLKLAVLSDFPVAEKLSALGLEGLWDYAETAETSGYLKPNPEPFLDLCGALGLEPAEVIYVGNHYEYDILGAKSVGMKAAYLGRSKGPKKAADFVFSDYYSFILMLEQENLL